MKVFGGGLLLSPKTSLKLMEIEKVYSKLIWEPKMQRIFEKIQFSSISSRSMSSNLEFEYFDNLFNHKYMHFYAENVGILGFRCLFPWQCQHSVSDALDTVSTFHTHQVWEVSSRAGFEPEASKWVSKALITLATGYNSPNITVCARCLFFLEHCLPPDSVLSL